MSPAASPPTDLVAAAAARDTLEELLALLPAGVIALDRAGRCRFVNAAGLDALGLDPDDAGAARGLVALLADEAVEEALRAAAADGQERRIALFVDRPDGRTSELGLTVVPAREEAAGEGGLGALMVFRALDDGRTLDRRMREIEHLAAVGRLGAGFAHEVRNPIAAIQGLAEGLLEELAEGSPLAEYGHRILGLVERIERLVRSCLDLGGAPVAHGIAVEPAALVASALRLSGAAERVVVEIEPDVPRVTADAPQTAECLRALVANAVEACEPPALARVRVRASPPDRQRVLFEIVDPGPGIPARLLGRIFEPFFTTKPRATGLGLAVARLVAARNRGTLEVRSRPGETVFTLALPVAEGPAGGGPAPGGTAAREGDGR